MSTRLLLAVVCLLMATPSLLAQQAARKESPFDAIRWTSDRPEVLIGETWYEPIAIDGLPIADILAFCQGRWPGLIRKRFGEDLVEALTAMGQEPGRRVDLELRRIDDGVLVRLQRVELSAAKRKAIRDAAAGLGRRDARVQLLDRDAAEADLEDLVERLRDQFAYLEMRGVDVDGEIERIRRDLGQQVEISALADRIHRLMMMFGDGHARVSRRSRVEDTLHLPALLVEADGGVVAIRPDRRGFIDPLRPYVVSIDGETIDQWIEALRPDVAAGSPQLIRRRALRSLRELAQLRLRRGLPAAPTVRLGLAGRDAAATRTIELRLTRMRPRYGTWPDRPSALLPGGIGYVRLPAMDDELVPELRHAMSDFSETRGLIVDVRGNGGGRRDLLLTLAGYLIGPDERPRVGNIAAYRRSDRFDDDHLMNRFVRRADWQGWTARQRRVIDAAARRFEPEWTLPDGFSDWHYLVLDRTGHPDEYWYDQPVVVIADAGCFSATDIFLGALAGHPRVTLLGAASGGGSARSQSFRLPNSGIEVACASMASFRPDGRLYDGRGVEVDVEVPPDPGDFLFGGGDRRLTEALILLEKAESDR